MFTRVLRLAEKRPDVISRHFYLKKFMALLLNVCLPT